MNQKTVIYIILSAILLYLYYKRGGVALFTAFVVVVAGTRFTGAGAREGLSSGGGGGGGGGEKGDKECVKLGFTAPKIDKKDIKGSLDKILKNFKNVVEKYADVEERGINVGKSNKEIEAIFKNDSAKNILVKWREDTNNNLSELIKNSFILFDPYIFTPSEERQQKLIEQLPEFIKNKEEVQKIINGGNRAVKMFEDVKKLDETGKLDKKAKTILDVTICAFKQTVFIWKSLVKAMGGEDAGDDAGDDEEEKPKKKKKTTKKKKSKKTEDEDDAAADE